MRNLWIRYFIGGFIFMIVINLWVWIYANELNSYEIEQSWRDQARRQLDGARNSIYELSSSTKMSVEDATYYIMKNMRIGGQTGDSHAYYLSNRQWLDTILFFDASSDCKIDSDVYKLEDVIPLFSDPLSAEVAIKKVLLWYDSEKYTSNYWYFDESKELLEYVRVQNWNEDFMLILGIQEDEYKSYTKLSHNMLAWSLFVSTFLQLFSLVLLFLLIHTLRTRAK